MPAVELADLAARSVNTTSPTLNPPFEVVCAWPLSGQYGPGSRILYYVLVAICTLARRAEWLRNACVAAALLFPVVAALHGIVLVTVHKDSAVDMDIYGAFQLCAIGVLVAPVAAAMSRTYFTNPGRNAIVLWSLLVVTGLISLTVEFYRVSSQPKGCWYDNQQQPLNASLRFPFENANCGLVCDPEKGPISRIRGGSADNIYVVPAPYVLTFNVCIMLTAACCIPAILLVAWMMVTSSHTVWTRRFEEQASLTMKVPVKLFDADTGMPSLDELRKITGTLNRIGVVGTEAYRIRRQSIACSPNNAVENAWAKHYETAPNSSAASSKTPHDNAGMALMLQDLHEKSALSVYDFELHGKPFQIREMKLAANVENFARQVYAALRDLENENVDVICVECIEVPENSPEARVMSWLRNEERAEKRSLLEKKQQRIKTPGAMILLSLVSLAVVASLVAGEMNFFSMPVNYQTEPMANVGQWAPVAGTILVVAGSLYVLIAEGMRKGRRRFRAEGDDAYECESGVLDRTIRALIHRLIKLSDLFDAPRWLFDHTDFQEGQKRYPLVPGEQHRNKDLQQTIEDYEPSRNSTDSTRSAATSRHSLTGGTASQHRDRESSTADPNAPPPPRKRTLTLLEVETPPRRRRSTHDSPPGTPVEPIVAQSSDRPTIVFSPDEHEDDIDHTVIR